MRELLVCLLAAFCISSCRAVIRDKVFVIQSPHEDNKLVVVTWYEETKEGDENTFACEIFKNKRLIEEIVKESENPVVRHPTIEEYETILKECSTFSLRKRRGLRRAQHEATRQENATPMPAAPTTVAGYDGWSIIFPGTKWCGPGDIAKHDNDLGLHQDTDRCCRTHDKCDDLMAPGETRNNITNTWPFTKLSCKCDNDFYDCLSRVNSFTSNTVGNAYFNIAKRSCYALDYPKSKKCKKWLTFLKLKCISYGKDTSKPKTYQWIPAKIYKRLPIPGPLDIDLPF